MMSSDEFEEMGSGGEQDFGDAVKDGRLVEAVKAVNVEDRASRDNLMTTAVRFLQSRVVKDRSLTEKQEFLKSKGLTDEEIKEALIRAQRHMESLQHVAATNLAVDSRSKVRDWSYFLLVLTGAAYGCYRLYKDFVIPFLTDQKSDSEALRDVLMKNTETLSGFGSKIESLQQACEKNSQKIDQIQTSSGSGGGREIKELKEELSSLKRLLLSRHQFPQTPVIKPVIPAWQLEESRQSELGASATTNANNSVPLDEGAADEGAADGAAVETADGALLSTSSPPGAPSGSEGAHQDHNGHPGLDEDTLSEQESSSRQPGNIDPPSLSGTYTEQGEQEPSNGTTEQGDSPPIASKLFTDTSHGIESSS